MSNHDHLGSWIIFAAVGLFCVGYIGYYAVKAWRTRRRNRRAIGRITFRLVAVDNASAQFARIAQAARDLNRGGSDV